MFAKAVLIPTVAILVKLGWDTAKIRSLRKRLERKTEEQDKRINKLEVGLKLVENNAVTESTVRKITREALQPVYDDQQEIKQSLKEITENVVKLRIANAPNKEKGA